MVAKVCYKILVVLAIILLIFSLTILLYLNKDGPLPYETALIIPKNSSSSNIAEKLYQNQIISSPSLFRIINLFGRPFYSLKAGEYLFKSKITPLKVIEILIKGKSEIHCMTIPEGIASIVVEEQIKNEYLLDGNIDNIAEGSILPETYCYSYGDSKMKLLFRMQEAQRKLLAEIWPKHIDEGAIKSVYEAVILASIVEREAKVKDEQPRIARVFINRLKLNMRLQADPTTIYGITYGKKLERSLTKADLMENTPYNTYVIYGLPPTPIANPGRDALKAVLNPAVGNEIFFVLNSKDRHSFSSDLATHNKNVEIYRNQVRNHEK